MKQFKQIDCFKSYFKFWKLLGLDPFPTSHPLLYEFYSKALVSFFCVLYSALFTLNLLVIPKRLDLFIDELTLYFRTVASLIKILSFLLKKEQIKNILCMLESDIFQSDSNEEIFIISKAKNTNQRDRKVYFSILCIISFIVNLLFPILQHFIFNVELTLPICSYSFIPNNIKQSLIYPLYFYQTIGMLFIMLSSINIDMFFVNLMMFAIAQLDILNKKLVNVTEDYITHADITDAALNLKLKNLVLHYYEVTRHCSLIEDIYSMSLFVQFSVSSCIICVCLVKFTMTVPWQYYIFLCSYTPAMVAQIYIPCLYGTRIIDKSYQLSQAIYSCDWISRSKRFKSSLRLFVERASRPLSITGWKMFPLSLTTVTFIMNSAYSFFTLLRNMQSK